MRPSRRGGNQGRGGRDFGITPARPPHLGLAASVGVDRLRVYRRLRAALFLIGDGLTLRGQRLAFRDIGSTPFLGSPGNPESLFAICEVEPSGSTSSISPDSASTAGVSSGRSQTSLAARTQAVSSSPAARCGFQADFREDLHGMAPRDGVCLDPRLGYRGGSLAGDRHRDRGGGKTA